MASISAFLAPSRRAVTYAPSTISVRAELAIKKLLAESDSIEEYLAHVVDRTALQEIQIACGFWPRANLSDSAKDALQRIQAAAKRLEVICDARIAAVSKNMEPRLAAERKQFAEAGGTIAPGSVARERERIYHAERLWVECGVSLDFEMVPAEVVDNAELTLHKIGEARMAAGYCDALVDLQGHFGDLHVSFEELAQELAVGKLFASPPSQPTEANCFVRELRFMGHGFAGDDTLPSAFAFTGELLDTPSLGEPALVAALAKMKNYMAPRSSVILDGCSTGRGEPGKRFIAALCKIFFGDLKHGYVRANAKNTKAPPANFREGLPTSDAVTYLWPDDF
ncbi:MAG: hypothetical protein ACRBN8_08795 [Nannocystales bacterium]